MLKKVEEMTQLRKVTESKLQKIMNENISLLEEKKSLFEGITINFYPKIIYNNVSNFGTFMPDHYPSF